MPADGIVMAKEAFRLVEQLQAYQGRRSRQLPVPCVRHEPAVRGRRVQFREGARPARHEARVRAAGRILRRARTRLIEDQRSFGKEHRHMDLGVADRNYVVLGGTRGIGLAAARALASRRRAVAVVGRDADKAEQARTHPLHRRRGPRGRAHRRPHDGRRCRACAAQPRRGAGRAPRRRGHDRSRVPRATRLARRDG